MGKDLLSYAANLCCAAAAALIAAAFINPEVRDEVMRGCWVFSTIGAVVTGIRSKL